MKYKVELFERYNRLELKLTFFGCVGKEILYISGKYLTFSKKDSCIKLWDKSINENGIEILVLDSEKIESFVSFVKPTIEDDDYIDFSYEENKKYEKWILGKKENENGK